MASKTQHLTGMLTMGKMAASSDKNQVYLHILQLQIFLPVSVQANYIYSFYFWLLSPAGEESSVLLSLMPLMSFPKHTPQLASLVIVRWSDWMVTE